MLRRFDVALNATGNCGAMFRSQLLRHIVSPLVLDHKRQDGSDDDTEASEVTQLTSMNEQQLTILAQQNEILALLKAQVSQV
jgi:hypothetical protein